METEMEIKKLKERVEDLKSTLNKTTNPKEFQKIVAKIGEVRTTIESLDEYNKSKQNTHHVDS